MKRTCQRTLSKSWVWVACTALLPVLALIVAGCAEAQTPAAPQEPVPEPEVRSAVVGPLTPASPPKDNGVTLFGALAPTDRPSLELRAAAQIQHTWIMEGADFDPDLDATGTRMVFASTRHSPNPDIYMKDVDGATVTHLVSNPASDIQPVFGPDGQHVAFASDRSGNWDIWVLDMETQQVAQVTRTPVPELHPTWSPDGARLAFCRQNEKSQEWELWFTELDNERPAHFIGYGLYPQWSPVEDQILFQRARRRGEAFFSLWTVQLTDGEPGYATELSASETAGHILPAWSRDGRYVAFCEVEMGGGIVAADGRLRSERSDVWVIDVTGRGRFKVSDVVGADYAPVWSPDGRVFFSSTRGGAENIWSVLPNLDVSAPPPPMINAGTEVTARGG